MNDMGEQVETKTADRVVRRCEVAVGRQGERQGEGAAN